MSVPSQVTVRTNDGTRPLIPPYVLLELLRRLAARAQ
jgi:hypothetical protein